MTIVKSNCGKDEHVIIGNNVITYKKIVSIFVTFRLCNKQSKKGIMRVARENNV